MSQYEEDNVDPAGSTQSFRRFVTENKERETAPRRPVLPYVLVGVGVVLAVVIVVTIVMLWG
ncbi:hypothetical protein [Salinactinospora qingdaonensis]